MRIAFSATILVLLVIFAIIELRRWRAPGMTNVLTKGQKRRRVIGWIALAVIPLMIIAGTFFPVDHISKRFAAEQIIYYALIFADVMVIPIVAMREFRETLKMGTSELRSERDTAFREMVDTVAKAEQESKHKAELPYRNGHG